MAKADPNDIQRRIIAARSAVQVLDAIARATWYTHHNGEECPVNKTPKPGDLAAWLPHIPPDVRTTADSLAEALGCRLEDDAGAIHSAWNLQPKGIPLLKNHPLKPVVDAWQQYHIDNQGPEQDGSLGQRVLEDANDAPQILEALANIERSNQHQGEECPPEMIPSENDLVQWLSLTSEPSVTAVPPLLLPALTETGKRLSVLIKETANWVGTGCTYLPDGTKRRELGVITNRDAVIGMQRISALFPKVPSHRVPGRTALLENMASVLEAIDWLPLATVHRMWRDMPVAERPLHPLAPIIGAWQQRPRQHEPFEPKPRASLPRLHRLSEDSNRHLTLDFPTYASNAPQKPGQMDLPGIEPISVNCPSWLLWLYDRAGGKQHGCRSWYTMGFAPVCIRVSPSRNRAEGWRMAHLKISASKTP